PTTAYDGGDMLFPMGSLQRCSAGEARCCDPYLSSNFDGPLRIPRERGTAILLHNTNLDGTQAKGEVGDCPLTRPDVERWLVRRYFRAGPYYNLADNFLTPEECRHLIGLAEHNLTLGRIGGMGGGGIADDDIRSSWQFYTHPNASRTDSILRRVLKRFQRAARIPD
ncbi:hypothetical protein FOZ63_015169, partial [Perkinsus olseni]